MCRWGVHLRFQFCYLKLRLRNNSFSLSLSSFPLYSFLKTYMFKLMNSSGVTESGESEKVLLLMESGVRLHTTEYVR